MKIFLYILLTVFYSKYALSQYKIRDSCANFTLNLEAENLPSDTIKLSYPDCYETPANIILSNGKATIKGEINRATEGILYTDIKNRWMDAPSVIRFLIEPADMTLRFRMVNDSAQDVSIEGSYSQKQKEAWQAENSPLLDLREKYRNGIALLSREKEKTDPTKFAKQHQTLTDKFNVLTELLIQGVLKYIKTNSHSYFSGYLLYHYMRLMPTDTLKTYYSYLDSSVMFSDLGKRTLEELFKLTNDWEFRQKFTDSATYKSLRKIKTVYDVSLPSLDGTEISFSKFKGNVLLIDFWASWCGPCIQNAPYLEKLISETKNKPFKVISVSIFDSVDTWKKAIKKYDFPGVHLFDDKGLLSTFYKVLWVPRYVLVNPDGSVADIDAPQASDPGLKISIENLLKKYKR